MTKHVPLRSLHTFCLVSRYLSFKLAADEICLTASAVSHQINDLESQLGFKLFHRLTRSIELTGKGEQLLLQIEPHFNAIDEAVVAMKADARRVPLHVQVPEFFASELLMPIIGAFSENYEEIDLRIESMNASDEMDPKADINITLSRKQPKGLRVEKLFPIRYIPACSHSLYKEATLKGRSGLQSVGNYTLLLHKARPNAWNRWAENAGIGGIKPRQIIYVDTMFALARAAEQGVGIALVPMPVSKAWFDTAALVPLHDADLVTEDYYWIVCNDKSRNSEAADKFTHWILTKLQYYATETDEPDSFVA